MAASRISVIAPSSYKKRQKISAQQELDVLREFVIHMMGTTGVNELCWYVAQEVVGRLGFVDCVIYRFDPAKNELVQAAAMGAGKNPKKCEIFNQLSIPLGTGITGSVANNQCAEIVHDASVDTRFVSDVMEAQSEICVPLVHEGKLLGVIDCEDLRKNYFNDRHMETLQTISSMTSAHWVQCQLIDKLETMRRDLENALQKSNIAQRAQSAFLASVSHELRTPLNAIVGFSSMMSGDAENKMPTESMIEFSRHIHQAGLHLASIVDDVLDISALASQKAMATPARIDLFSEIGASIKLAIHKAKDHGIEIEWDGSEAEQFVWFDPRHLKQILTNLLDNAIKYGPGETQVFLSVTERDDGGLDISVQDFGIGISADVQSYIFEPFRRDPAALDKDIKGVGLGLSLVREMVHANGAEISFTSQLGEGSTFTLTLPCALISGATD